MKWQVMLELVGADGIAGVVGGAAVADAERWTRRAFRETA
jgi:hypothetical protein